jgi:hypothetical protein
MKSSNEGSNSSRAFGTCERKATEVDSLRLSGLLAACLHENGRSMAYGQPQTKPKDS